MQNVLIIRASALIHTLWKRSHDKVIRNKINFKTFDYSYLYINYQLSKAVTNFIIDLNWVTTSCFLITYKPEKGAIYSNFEILLMDFQLQVSQL